MVRTVIQDHQVKEIASGMVGQGYFKVGGGRNCFRDGKKSDRGSSGKRYSFSDGENRDIFRWEKLFQGW
jgi:hypothetical protein